MALQKGDDVVCINARIPHGQGELIEGKIYTISKDSETRGMVFVINEFGKEEPYGLTRFLPTLKAKKIMLPKNIARMQIMNLARRLQCHAEFIEVGNNYMMVRFVSQLFDFVTQRRRREVIDFDLRTNCKRVLEDYEIIYETYSPTEVLLLGVFK